MMEEFAQEADFTNASQPSFGKITTDPDISSQSSKGKSSSSGFSKMMEEIADEVGLFQSDNKSSAGKTIAGTDIAEIKRKIFKPFKKE